MIYWIFLFLGIATEIVGTTAMRALVFDNAFYGQIAATVGITFSYYFISKAVIKIPVAISYSIWSGVGLAGISILSFLLFNEKMSTIKIIGLISVGIGMIILNFEKNDRKS